MSLIHIFFLILLDNVAAMTGKCQTYISKGKSIYQTDLGHNVLEGNYSLELGMQRHGGFLEELFMESAMATIDNYMRLGVLRIVRHDQDFLLTKIFMAAFAHQVIGLFSSVVL